MGAAPPPDFVCRIKDDRNVQLNQGDFFVVFLNDRFPFALQIFAVMQQTEKQIISVDKIVHGWITILSTFPRTLKGGRKPCAGGKSGF